MTVPKWTVTFTAGAAEQADGIHAWWSGNRPAAPDLFAEEVERAIKRLALLPGSGAPFASEAVADLRRILLPATRYHVYYTVHTVRREVLVRAIWHASRGERPELA